MPTPTIPTLTLPTGAPIPQFGFGTFKVTEGVYEAVSHALELGYRHIDTAQMYGNEPEVGRAIADSEIPREELFITSKLNNTNHEPDVARATFAQTLEDLRTDYVDLFLIHWPLPTLYDGNVALPWSALEEFYADGRARAIGLSNYEIAHIRRFSTWRRWLRKFCRWRLTPSSPTTSCASSRAITPWWWKPGLRWHEAAPPLTKPWP